jgi:uncharacterized membrane protein YphA (DoxX/SURF4 family)
VDGLYSRFPGGRVGVALLLLRFVDGAGLTGEAMRLFNPITASAEPTSVVLFSVGLVTSAIMLILGFRTSLAGSAAAICSVGTALYSRHHAEVLGTDRATWLFLFAVVVLVSSALALLGAGGYSLDARLSGWRTIRLSLGKPNRPNEWDIWS